MGSPGRPGERADLEADVRWQLVQRIVASHPFQKSNRLRELLLFLSERTLRGHTAELTEQRIGQAVFDKGADFTPLEDSSIRVYARQLRLKLHEYFDTIGREETMVVEIPKGTYVPIFRPAGGAMATPENGQARPAVSKTIIALAGLLCLACALAGYWLGRTQVARPGVQAASPPWPLSRVIDDKYRTQIVVADANYGMVRLMARQPGSLEQYLAPEFPHNLLSRLKPDPHLPIFAYITRSSLTSFADVSVVSVILKLAGALSTRVDVRSARDFRMRDLEEGNFVFIGSPGSNPWVTLFEPKLNFCETEATVGEARKAFLNKRPLAGEQPRYQGLAWTGNAGEDFAGIALLPNEARGGSILVLQGLQQEGTEAAGLFLASEEGRHKLQEALRLPAQALDHAWFEALIRTKAVAGATNTTEIVASRAIR